MTVKDCLESLREPGMCWVHGKPYATCDGEDKVPVHHPENGEKYWRVELAPQPQVIHLATRCGPEHDLIMVNFYERTRWLTFAEALELASALIAAAWAQDTEAMKLVLEHADARAWLGLAVDKKSDG